jgi:hypothetical protein
MLMSADCVTHGPAYAALPGKLLPPPVPTASPKASVLRTPAAAAAPVLKLPCVLLTLSGLGPGPAATTGVPGPGPAPTDDQLPALWQSVDSSVLLSAPPQPEPRMPVSVPHSLCSRAMGEALLLWLPPRSEGRRSEESR